MNTYFSALSESLKCHPGAFQKSPLMHIRQLVSARNIPSSYIFLADDICKAQSEISGKDVLVIPILGMNADALGDLNTSHTYVAVKPLPDGISLSCLMLAGGRVALSSRAIHCVGTSENAPLRILWLFDDKARLSCHHISDNIYDSMRDALKNNNSTRPQEETSAWKTATTQATSVDVLEYFDMRYEYEAPLSFNMVLTLP